MSNPWPACPVEGFVWPS